MKQVSQVLQFSVIVKGRRPFARESQLFEKLDFFRGCIALQGGILKERLKPRLLVARGGFPFDELKSLRVPGRQTASTISIPNVARSISSHLRAGHDERLG